mgnify:FL=1
MRLKLISAYVLTLAALMLVGYVAYNGLQQLISTLYETTTPPKEAYWVDRIFQTVLKAENNIRIFTITREEKYLKPYEQSVDKINVYMAMLNKLESPSKEINRDIGKMDSLLQKKFEVQQALINLYKTTSLPDTYRELYEELEIIEEEQRIQDSISETKEVEKPSFFKRLFGKQEEEQEDTLKAEIPGTLRESIKEMEQVESRQRELLEARELVLTRKDREISDEISVVVASLDKRLERLNRDRAIDAALFFQQTTQYITVIGTAAAIVILLLVILLLRDYQIILRARKALEAARRRSDDLAAYKEQFLAQMSHEIRTPLNAIIGFTSQLVNANGSPAQRFEQLKIVHNASQYLLSLINNVLDYSKLEAGKMVEMPSVFDPGELIDGLKPILSPYAEEKGLEIEWLLKRHTNYQLVKVDRDRVRQILFNLISNAIKYTSKGRITIEISLESKNMRLQISDTGKGFREEDKAKLFERFAILEKEQPAKWSSTGIGLSIVYQIVQMLKGTIEVESEVNKGSVFIIDLPCETVETASPQGGTTKKMVNLSGYHLLLADDDIYNLKLLETLITGWGASIASAGNDAQILDLCQKQSFDMLLIDLQMPVLDGYEVVEKIRKNDPQTPVIALTAHLDEHIMKRCLQAGFSQVLTKPIENDFLLTEIEKYLKPKAESDKFNADHHSDKSKSDTTKTIDNGFGQKMTEIYLKSLKNFMKEAVKALQNEHDMALKKLAHKLIPSTQHMGFPYLLEILEQIDDEELTDPNVLKIKTGEALEEANKIVEVLKYKLDIQ